MAFETQDIAALRQENQMMRRIIEEIHWMARRYAEGRSTFSASTYNECVRGMISLGIPINKCDGIIWARDGGGRNFDKLSDEQCIEGTKAALGEE